MKRSARAKRRLCIRQMALVLPLGFLLSLALAACAPGAELGTPTVSRASTAITTTRTATSMPTASTNAVATSTSAVPPVPTATLATSMPVSAPTLMMPTPISLPSPAAAGTGTLVGHASIGPLTPVERVGVPSPTPSPQVCTSRGLAIYAADGMALVTTFSFQPDCSYQVALAPGTYVVRLRDTPAIGGSRNLPKTVSLVSGQTVVLDIEIDTGIR